MVEWALGRLAEARTASDVIALALDETPAICHADAFGVYLFRAGSLDVHSRGASDRAVSRYLALPAGSDPLLLHMQHTRSPVHERSIFSSAQWRAHPLYESAAGPFGSEHYVISPLLGRGEIIGALTLARTRSAPAFTDRDLPRRPHPRRPGEQPHVSIGKRVFSLIATPAERR